jgi:hypothetical protein
MNIPNIESIPDNERADLRGSDLSDRDLRDRDLSDKDLRGSDLSGSILIHSNLRRSNLDGVRLWDTIGNMREINSLQIERYQIAYTYDRLQIGCENHSIDEWRQFSDEEIAGMDTGALEWWRKWRDIIFQIIEMSPADKP